MVHDGVADYFQVLKAIAGGDVSKAIRTSLEFKYNWTEKLLYPLADSLNHDQDADEDQSPNENLAVVGLVRHALETSRDAALKVLSLPLPIAREAEE
jgi:hypothetical protein